MEGEPLRANTVIDYERALRLYITPHLGERIPSEITRADIRDWHNNLLRSVSDRPKAKAYAVLRTIMNSAVEEELIDVNPVSIRGAGVARRKHGIEPASLDELAIIVEAMPERFRLMVQLATWCALRYGELAELRRKDVDLTRDVIKIRRAVTFTPMTTTVGPPKTDAGIRDVAVPPHLSKAIRAHLKGHTQPGGGSTAVPGRLRRTPPRIGAVPPLEPGPDHRGPARAALPRPPTHRRHTCRPGGSDNRRASGPTWPHDRRRRDDLPARRQRPRRTALQARRLVGADVTLMPMRGHRASARSQNDRMDGLIW